MPLLKLPPRASRDASTMNPRFFILLYFKPLGYMWGLTAPIPPYHGFLIRRCAPEFKVEAEKAWWQEK